MDAWEYLAKIDHEMMQIDIGLMEWQGNLDMAALAGIGLPLELWTDDDPPKLITKDVVSQAIGRPLRVMHVVDGRRVQIGVGEIDSHGQFTAEVTAEVSSEFMGRLGGFSIEKPELFVPEVPPYEVLVGLRGSGVVELPRIPYEEIINHPATKRSIKGIIPDLDDHSFFKEQ